MSQSTDTRYFPQIQTVCHPATEWHTAHLWATHTLAPAQNLPDFFRYGSKLEIARIAGQSDTKKCFADTNGLQFSYDSCTPLSYGRAPKCQTDLASP